MSNVPDSLAEIVGKVSQRSGSVQDYEKLNIILRNLSKEDLEIALSNHNLLNIFGHMNLSDSEISDLALNMASVIFSTFDLTDFVRSHESELFMAISSKNYSLRDFIISRLTEGVRNNTSEDLQIPDEILYKISQIATIEEITHASSSLMFIKSFGVHHPQGVEKLLELPIFKNHFSSAQSGENMIRVSELFGEIASEKPEKFCTMANSACFDGLLSAFATDDPLLQLNAIAVLKLLIMFSEGRAFLQSKGTIASLISNLQSLDNNPLRDLLLPGYVTFFGALAATDPPQYVGTKTSPSPLLCCLSTSLSGANLPTELTALETVAFICRTSVGKTLISPHFESDGCLSVLLAKMGVLLLNSSTELIPRILLIIADLIRVSRSEDLHDVLPVARLTWTWMNRMTAPAPPSRLLLRAWELARQPFHDVRSSALQLIEAIATEPWGITLFVGEPRFMDYLLTRNTEIGTGTDNPSLQPAKFAIVCQCQRTQQRWNGVCPQWTMFDDESLQRIENYLKEGVWGSVSAQAVVAMEQG